VTVSRFLSGFVLCAFLIGSRASAQQEASEKKPDTFFAGNVTEFTPQKISVSRVVSGKKENRTFRMTPDTKVEGKLRTKVRVTVRYSSDDDGDTATLIIVRTNQK
jgi:hypothetical protein